MRAYLINTKDREITEVEYDGTPAGLASLFPYQAMNCLIINGGGDAMMYNPAGMQDGTWDREHGWQTGCVCGCGTYVQYAGRCIIFGTILGNMDVPADPYFTLRSYLGQVEWTDIKSASSIVSGRNTVAFDNIEDAVDYFLGSEGKTLQ